MDWKSPDAEIKTDVTVADEKNEETMGELIHFFILAAIAGALLLEVNPFDQPGVEDYKKLIQEELK